MHINFRGDMNVVSMPIQIISGAGSAADFKKSASTLALPDLTVTAQQEQEDVHTAIMMLLIHHIAHPTGRSPSS